MQTAEGNARRITSLKAQIADYHHESIQQDASRDRDLRTHLDKLCKMMNDSKAQMRGFQKTLQQFSEQIIERGVGKLDEEQTKLLDDMQDMQTTSLNVQRRATMRIQALTSLAEETSLSMPVPAQCLPPLPPRMKDVSYNDRKAAVEERGDTTWTFKPKQEAAPVTTLTRHSSGATQSTDEQTVSPPSAAKKNSSLSLQDFEATFGLIMSTAKERRMGVDKPFSDEVMLQVSKSLASVGKQAWSDRPRTYLVLRLIDEVSAMDNFILEGLKDIHFPYDEANLPNCIQSPGLRHSFLKNQRYVFSERSIDLVSGGRHHHLGRLMVPGLQKF
jgi:hypothetical protein